MKFLIAFLLAQAVAIPPPPQTATLATPRARMSVTAKTHPPEVLIPGTPGPLHPTPPSHLPSLPWFDGYARAVLVAQTPTGYRVTVMRANGAHVTQDYVEQSVSLELEMK